MTRPRAMKRVPTPNEAGLCSVCILPFDGDKIWHNGFFAHVGCAIQRELWILGDDALLLPGLLEHLDALEERRAFLERLGTEAAKLGMDLQLLATAVERATR